MFNIIRFPKKEDWKKIVSRPVINLSDLEGKVNPILKSVKEGGDEALKRLTLQFDNVDLPSLAVSEEEFIEAKKQISSELKDAILIASNNIKKFHSFQKEPIQKIETTAGVYCWRKSVAIDKVGLYIPGGTAPLFSSILMLGIPATMAGCQEIIVCSPPNDNGKLHPAILYTCEFLGIKKVFKVGGAQAIAAMAYGTESIPGVYKIFGPGNQYVTAAKQLVTKEGIAIDMPAGPSEVAVIGDSTCEPKFVAADLLSQAEHGVDSQVVFITNDEQILNSVLLEVEKQTNELSRKDIIKKCLKNSRFILTNTIDEAILIVEEYAPEHLILQVKEYEQIGEKIRNAGSVFLGNFTPEAAGDYASGTNHTLPTNGYARSYAGVSLDSFIKKITFQHISKEGIENLGPIVEMMAETEELYAHKNAVKIRRGNLQ